MAAQPRHRPLNSPDEHRDIVDCDDDDGDNDDDVGTLLTGSVILADANGGTWAPILRESDERSSRCEGLRGPPQRGDGLPRPLASSLPVHTSAAPAWTAGEPQRLPRIPPDDTSRDIDNPDDDSDSDDDDGMSALPSTALTAGHGQIWTPIETASGAASMLRSEGRLRGPPKRILLEPAYSPDPTIPVHTSEASVWIAGSPSVPLGIPRATSATSVGRTSRFAPHLNRSSNDRVAFDRASPSEGRRVFVFIASTGPAATGTSHRGVRMMALRRFRSRTISSHAPATPFAIVKETRIRS